MLFNKAYLNDFLNNKFNSLKNEIEQEKEETLVNFQVNEYFSYLYDKYKIKLINLIENDAFAEEKEKEVLCRKSNCSEKLFYNRNHYRKIQVLNYTIPFEGDLELLYLKPTFNIIRGSSNINIDEVKNEIYFEIPNEYDDIKCINQEVKNIIEWIKNCTIAQTYVSFKRFLKVYLKNWMGCLLLFNDSFESYKSNNIHLNIFVIH